MNYATDRRRVRSGLAALVVAALLIAPVAALALTPKSGAWQGSTSQGKSVSFTVRGGKVRNVRFRWKANCSFGSATGTTQLSAPLPINGNGRFSYSSSSTTFAGKFTSKRQAKGTLSYKFTDFATGGTCTTGRVGWHAHHR